MTVLPLNSVVWIIHMFQQRVTGTYMKLRASGGSIFPQMSATRFYKLFRI
jgi:hypothetical protein